MLSEEMVKQIFFQSDRPRKDALLATEVDIIQFAHNIELYIAHEYAMQELTECVKFVRSLNTEVGDALQNNRQRKSTNG